MSVVLWMLPCVQGYSRPHGNGYGIKTFETYDYGEHGGGSAPLDSVNLYIQQAREKIGDGDMQEAEALLEDAAAIMASRQPSNILNVTFTVVGLLLIAGFMMALIYYSRAKSRNLELLATNAELMTAREIAEDAFDQAKLASEVESRFLQNMSHEIRTPLNAVLGFSQMLGLPDEFITVEERQEYSKFIADNAELLLTIIDDMISVADVERGEFKVRYQTAKMQEICVRAIKSVEHRMPAGVEFKFIDNLPEDFKVETDVMRVHQVLVNILTNACKNTFSGSITMQLDLREDGATSLCVTDTGVGIPPESIPFIFDRFYKVDPNMQGAGLGLHTSLAISRCLGAKLYLDASYTDGARFYFILPPRKD